jgi:methionyl-tRNA synthetase
MYVWVDALTNYLTGLGYPDDTEDFRKFWPADLHLIGKDIVRVHAVYWPAFLMSAGLPLPRAVFAHGFLLNRGVKESKTLGNVTDPGELADRYGVDTLRYFLLREFSFGQDGSWSHEAIVNRANAELANSFGNLAQRTLSMIFKNLDGNIREILDLRDSDSELESLVRSSIEGLQQSFDRLAFSDGLQNWMNAVFACNQYVDEQAPWALRKVDPERMAGVLMTLFRCMRDLAIGVSAVVPTSAGRLLDQMGIPAEERDFAALTDPEWFNRLARTGFRVAQPVGVFPRLELPEAAGD